MLTWLSAVLTVTKREKPPTNAKLNARSSGEAKAGLATSLDFHGKELT